MKPNNTTIRYRLLELVKNKGSTNLMLWVDYHAKWRGQVEEKVVDKILRNMEHQEWLERDGEVWMKTDTGEAILFDWLRKRVVSDED
jgi:hypothetical protein